MDSFDLGNSLPFGFCGECLERMGRGSQYGSIKLQQGRTIVHAYCAHRQAGGTLVLRSGWPARWTITVPIDVLDWQKLVQVKAETLSKFLDATVGAPATGANLTAPAPELLQ